MYRAAMVSGIQVERSLAHLDRGVDVVCKSLSWRDRTLGDSYGSIIPVCVVEHHSMGVDGCSKGGIAESIGSVNADGIASVRVD